MTICFTGLHSLRSQSISKNHLVQLFPAAVHWSFDVVGSIPGWRSLTSWFFFNKVNFFLSLFFFRKCGPIRDCHVSGSHGQPALNCRRFGVYQYYLRRTHDTTQLMNTFVLRQRMYSLVKAILWLLLIFPGAIYFCVRANSTMWTQLNQLSMTWLLDYDTLICK